MESLIYKIDDVLLLETLIKYGCIKILTTFCCIDKHFYRIFKKNKDKYYKQLLYLQNITPSHFERFCKFDENYCFDFGSYKLYTKFYNLVSNSDVCGCINKKSIIHMKIPPDHYKYTLKKGHRDKGYTHQTQAVYYTFYPSNTELVISKFRNNSEKKLLDEDIIDKDYFKNSKTIKYDLLFNDNYEDCWL